MWNQDNWKELEYCVQTGEPSFRRTAPHGDPFSRISQDPERAKIFGEAMATFALVTAAAIAATHDFSLCGKVVDVGGGNGALPMGILEANPMPRGFVFDLPHAADKARLKIAEARLPTFCLERRERRFESESAQELQVSVRAFAPLSVRLTA
ncbi:MAG: methyltransferase [Candidatus Binataceae bacterium]